MYDPRLRSGLAPGTYRVDGSDPGWMTWSVSPFNLQVRNRRIVEIKRGHRPKAFQLHILYLHFQPRSIRNESKDSTRKVTVYGVQSKIRQQV